MCFCKQQQENGLRATVHFPFKVSEFMAFTRPFPTSLSFSNLARTKFSRFTFLLLFRLLAPRVVIANDNRPEAFSERKINRETH
jgi:hypothetical protein